jgi:glycosyltransferase involved in cell wall biosynthesis
VYICTFSPDEPVREVLEAAGLLDEGTRLYVTGSGGAWLEREGVRPHRNAVLTGFLPEREYLRLLQAASAVMVLTRRKDCLLCGAYEAVAVGKPLIVSDTEALRTHFSRGTLYATNEPADIAAKINEAVACGGSLTSGIVALRRELDEVWEQQRRDLEDLLALLGAPGSADGSPAGEGVP